MNKEKPEYKFRAKDFVPGRGWFEYSSRNGKGTPHYGKQKQLTRTMALMPYHFVIAMPVSIVITAFDAVKESLEKRTLKSSN